MIRGAEQRPNNEKSALNREDAESNQTMNRESTEKGDHMTDYTIGVLTGDENILNYESWMNGFDEQDNPMIHEAISDYMQRYYQDNGEYRQRFVLFVGGYKVTALKKQGSPVIITNICKVTD